MPVGFWMRAVAKMIDTGMLAFIDFGLRWVLAGSVGLALMPMRVTGAKHSILGWAITVAETLSYYVIFETLAGTTFGKLVARAQVVSMDLGRVRLTQAIKRSVALAVDLFAFGAVAAVLMSESPFKQRVGDRWGKTRVVDVRTLPSHRRPSALRCTAAWFISVTCSAASTVVAEHLRVVRL